MNASGSRVRIGHWLLRVFAVAASLAALVSTTTPAFAADLDEARPLFIKGDFKKCIKQCEEAIREGEPEDEWRVLLARSMMAMGSYSNAFSVVSTNLERFPWSVQLRLIGLLQTGWRRAWIRFR